MSARSSLIVLHQGPRAASVLVGVLWCLALLSIVVIGVLHTSRTDLVIVKNYGDRIQAHYLAVAGIEKAKALLYQDARQRSRSHLSHSGQLYDAPDQFREMPFGRGQFSVLRRAHPDEGGGVLYGVSDEESLLNVNTASQEELSKVQGITPDVVASIIDWRDEDDTVTPGGAESEYYLSFKPPYLARNGPAQTLRELLMVRGISPELLMGRDRHENGLLDLDEKGEAPNISDPLDLGWAGSWTVNSSVNNVNAAGDERVNVQSADESSLTRVPGITTEIARAIVAYRGQHQFNSVADLLDVTPPQNQNQANSPGRRGGPMAPNAPDQNASGPKVISPALLMDICDDITTQGDSDLPGVVNINTASLEVLICLPGLTRELAQQIISLRQSNGFFPNIAHLLQVPGLSQDILKQLAPRITARSETFRILCEGKLKSSGVRQRIQEIVHVGFRTVTTVSYREDDL